MGDVSQAWTRLTAVLVQAGLASSRSEARRLIEQGAIKMQMPGREAIRVTDPLAIVTAAGVLHRKRDFDSVLTLRDNEKAQVD